MSSPGDAHFERGRLERVIERLNGEFQGIACLSPVRWETEFYKSDKTFQAQIPEAAQCDIVVAIFRSRLGTELPAEFPHMVNGEPYPSGTAYELLSAIEAAKERGLPDVYVFRCPQPPSVQLDDPSRAEIEAQWERLKKFFETWFRTQAGHFKAAFQTFASTDEFEAQSEALLRKWLEDNVLHGRAMAWPVELKGTPFRGLAAFGAKHAPVFFGRSREVAKSVERLKDAAEKGCRFLLIDGASGAGKSSLVRAGLVPRLTAAGVIPNVDVWRVALMRPGELSGNPFASLARALLAGSDDLPEDERGRPPGLPELRAGDFPKLEDLSALFAHADATALGPLIHTLDVVARAERQSGGYEREVNTALLLVVDQLDELFGVAEEIRTCFANLLDLLARNNRVWVVVTLRADLFDRFLGDAKLKQLKEDGASYDLAPPDAAALTEIVRGPAFAAGLDYEMDPASGETLDELLLTDAGRPDLLPLLQFTLNQLFEEAKQSDLPRLLTFKAYRALGGLEGAVNKEAEAALQALGSAEQGLLPRLLRELVASAQDGYVTSGHAAFDIRPVPLAVAAYDDNSARLVQALINARILLSSSEGSEATLRLAHARVLDAWDRAKIIVAENTDFYRIRADVEAQWRRYEEGGRRGELLLRGRPLAEAEDVVKKHGGELTRQSLDYVRASRARANRSKLIAWGVAAIFGLLAVGTTALAKFALDQMLVAQGRETLVTSQSSLMKGNITEAIQEGLGSFVLLPSEAARSNLIAALSRVSPYLLGVLESSADLPAPIAWIDGNTAAIPVSSGELRYWTEQKPSGSLTGPHWTAQAPADIKGQDGVAVALRRTADGSFIIVYSDGTIGILRDQTAKATVYESQNSNRIYPLSHAAAISKNGTVIVMSSIVDGLKSLRCDWHTNAPKPCAAYHLPFPKSGDFRAVAISPDERGVAVGDQAGEVFLCDPTSCRAVATSLGAAIEALDWSHDGKALAVGTMSGEVSIIDATSLAELARAQGEKPVTALAWSPTSFKLATACDANVICLWTVPSNSQGRGLHRFTRLVGHSGHLLGLYWSPNGTTLASISDDREIRAWSTEQDKSVLYELPECGASEFDTLAVSSEFSTIAAGGADGLTCVWDAAGDKLLATSANPDHSAVESLAWSNDGSLATLHGDGALDVWSKRQLKATFLPRLPTELFSRVIWGADNSILAVTASNGRVALLDPTAPSAKPRFFKYISSSDGASGMAVRPSDDALFVSYSHGAIGIISLSTESLLGVIPAPPSFSGSLSLSPDGRVLAASGSDSHVDLYDTEKKATWKKVPVEVAETRVVAFSPDGQKLAVLGSSNGVVYVWDMSAANPTLLERLDLSSSAMLTGDRRDTQRVNWIGWLASDKLAVVSSQGKIIAISLDETKWRSQIRELGLASTN